MVFLGGAPSVREHDDLFAGHRELAELQAAFPGYEITPNVAFGTRFLVARARDGDINPSVAQSRSAAGLRQMLEGAVQPFDVARPNVARVYDAWLGGKDNFAADRELAGQIQAVFPRIKEMARENRGFLDRAVTYVTRDCGIRQFIDVGAGLPTARNTHEIVREHCPDCRVVYVDNDPVVVVHARALLATAGVSAISGDMKDPAAILGHPELRDLIDLGEPACVILASVLHFTDAATARDITTAFTSALAPGSYVVISVGRGEDEEAARFREVYQAGGNPIYGFTLEQVAGLFDGLELVPPGLAEARHWRPGWETREPPGSASILGGVGRKPS